MSHNKSPWQPFLTLTLSLSLSLTLTLTLTLTLSLTLFTLCAQAQDVVAVRAGKIITMAGPLISNGIILIRNGKIADVGANIKVPAGAQVIDERYRVVIPGLVAAYSSLASAADAPESISPDMRAVDGFDFFASYDRLLRSGLTTAYIATGSRRLVGGQGAAVKLAGSSVDSRTLLAGADVRVALGALSKNPPSIFRPAIPPTTTNPLLPAQRQLASVRPAEFALLRQLLADARYDRTHPNAPVHIVGVGASDAALHMAERHDKLRPFGAVIEGKRPLRVTANTVSDIRLALQFASDENVHIVLEGAAEGGKIASEIAARNVPVVAESPAEIGTVVTADYERTVASESADNIARLVRAGVRVALMPRTESDLDDLLLFAGAQTAYGVPSDTALRAVTITAAQIIGVDSRVGSIERGKDADMVVLSGSPLSASSQVEATIVGGRVVYSRKGADANANDLTAIRAGRVYTVSHGVIENGIVLIRGGKIVAVSSDGIVPPGAKLIDASHSCIMPGIIDSYSYLGLHTDALQPAVDPAAPASGSTTARMRLATMTIGGDPAFAEALKSGVTAVLLAPHPAGAVSGTAALIKPIPAPPRVNLESDRIVRDPAAICFNLQGGAPRMAQPWVFEELLQNAKSYNQRRIQYMHDEAQWEHDTDEAKKQKKDPPAEPTEVVKDEDQEPFAALFRGQIPAIVHVSRVDEIESALKVFSDENSLTLTLVGAGEGYHVIEDIRKHGAHVALGPDIEKQDHGATINLAAEMSAAGVPVILEGSSSSGTQLLRLNAANAVHNGMDPIEALRAITLSPAESLKVQSRLGSIDAGKDADLVILDGDPLELTSHVEKVLVNGKVVFDSHAKQ